MLHLDITLMSSSLFLFDLMGLFHSNSEIMMTLSPPMPLLPGVKL